LFRILFGFQFELYEIFNCFYSDANAAAVLKGASHHENLVYQIISEAGNKGELYIAVVEIFMVVLLKY
jgi:hypothetical protein